MSLPETVKCEALGLVFHFDGFVAHNLVNFVMVMVMIMMMATMMNINQRLCWLVWRRHRPSGFPSEEAHYR